MRRESAEVTAAARRRLELLGRELGQYDDAGPVGDDPAGGPGVVGPVPVRTVVVPEPGRHARAGRATAADRLRDQVRDRVADRLPDGLRARISLGPAQLGLVALVVAAGLAVAAWSTLRSAPSQTPVPVAHTSRPTSAAAGPSATASAGGAPTGSQVVVDVTGKVLRPGVVSLADGARVVDAIRSAGGARPGVDLSGLNLARKLVDGEQILVGLPAARAPTTAVSAAPPSSSGTSTSSGPAGAAVSLNTATLSDLEALPGVGPVTAQKILDWRTEHGSFTSVDELLEVDGIGDKTLAEIAPHVTL